MLMGGKGESVRHNERENLWALKRGCLQYDSWANWYHFEFGKIYFPLWLTVPMEWPPTTSAGAETVAKWLSDIRDSKFGADKSPVSTTPVPPHPKPWDGAKFLPKSPPCVYPGMESSSSPEGGSP